MFILIDHFSQILDVTRELYLLNDRDGNEDAERNPDPPNQEQEDAIALNCEGDETGKKSDDEDDCGEEEEMDYDEECEEETDGSADENVEEQSSGEE